MAKKTTKKKVSKPGVKKQAAATRGSKVVKKKTTKKQAVAKKPTAKSTSTKQASGKKKAPAKKTAKKTTKKTAKPSAKSSKTAKSKTTKVKVSKTASAGSSNPGKTVKVTSKAKPAPPIRRVVRPAPPPPPEPVVEDWTPISNAKLKRVKTGLTRKELNGLKQILLEKRAQIVGAVLTMEDARSAGNGGDLSSMPLHMADIGSDNYEQEFTLGLVESERKLLVEIDAALKRIQDKTYGVCIITGTPIPKERLEIKPWAKYSIEVVRKREKLGLHSF